MDVLSDALRVIRLKGSLFLHAEFGEPWCVAANGADGVAQNSPPTRERIADCHLVVEGHCWAELPGSEPVAVRPGDVVVVPHGDPHLLGSGVNHTRATLRDAVAVKLPQLSRVRYGGGGATTVIICGWFAYERHVSSPVMAALPRLFCTNLRNRASSAWLEGSMRYVVREATSGRAGAEVVADRLAEVLFVEALRGYAESLPDGQTGWLAGLRDPVVGRSIALIHEQPAEAWTVGSLARAVHVSRTVLAERFVALVGVPPMQYLANWRLSLAAHYLRAGQLTLTRIAEEVGYESEAAFSRAFKRRYGMARGGWRKASHRPAPP